jgi:hypothetical protein
MSLKHDPSAIRYASTQEAYGTTWTLDSIDSDGAQTWKNAKGHTALVQKAVEQVAAPVWKLMDVSSSPPLTALTLSVVEPNGFVTIHDSIVYNKVMTEEEIQQACKVQLNRMGMQTARVAVDRANEGNRPRPYPPGPKLGEQRISADGSKRWMFDGITWKRTYL